MTNLKKRKFKEKLHEIIFEADTQMGKLFDIVLLILITISILVVMLESIDEYNERYHELFIYLEWGLTILFTIEYFLRIYSVYKPKSYIISFFGLVDLLAILPTYLSLIFVSTHYLLVIRALRLLRMFRIFKFGHHVNQGKIILKSLKNSIPKITVFLYFVILMVIIFGSIMYLIEGNQPNSNFDNIPRSIYWAIVTLTTVGYGDISPTTPLGQLVASMVMILGYAVIAVPTGIVSAELIQDNVSKKNNYNTQSCRYCSREGHDSDAEYCKYCGQLLNEEDSD
jgi:voltage-gated potassium channel